MYVEGKPFDRGVINGKLSGELIYIQEKAFVDRIREMIPSQSYLKFLKYFIYWFNRNLDQYMPEEYKLEIFGISFSASDEFSFIGSNYQRMLNYHSAHDVGHALQELSLVGCSSFGAWGSMTPDSSLVIGRNFDFYAGDDFAENKLICFEKPDSGYPFMMVTWAGMIGTVSGMNDQGLTVTINAAKSDIPYSARTPISIVAREILQYAGTISEAYAIACKRETFVSESLLIGSAKDNKAAIIEKKPFRLTLVNPTGDMILCTNHFQSETFGLEQQNVENKRDHASGYRYMRLSQLVSEQSPLSPEKVAVILRDQMGLNRKQIGMGNEKAMNQLIAHHSLIFQPKQRLVWVSTGPWQLGPYVCYDLRKIFRNFAVQQQRVEITEPDRIIPADSFLGSENYLRFLRFKNMRSLITQKLKSVDNNKLTSSFIHDFENSNPDYYETYSLIGNYYFQKRDWKTARKYFYRALTKEIPRWDEKLKIIRKLADCNIRTKTN